MAILEAVQSRRRCGGAGVDVAVERFVALSHLLPFAHRESVAVAARDQLLGAELLGPSVEHTAHLLAWAIQAGVTVSEALRMPFYHPVVEEGIRTALRDLANTLKLSDRREI